MAAEPAATMSGANEAIAAAEQERAPEVAEVAAVDAQPAAQASSSLPSAADEASNEAPAATSGTAADAEPASSTVGGVLEAPRPPPAAVVRSATDQDDEIAPVTSSGTPVCNITLLLPTGNRHPFKIDAKYLSKRGVAVPDVTEAGIKDPFSISVYKLKELILREWREDWESKPASPSSIRLIHFGKLLDDKEQLRKYHFSPDAPNVVHMSVKPAEMMEDEEAAKGKSSGREARVRESGGGCCVIL